MEARPEVIAWATTNQVAELLGIDKSYLSKMCSKGDILARRFCEKGHWRIALGPDGFPIVTGGQL